MFDPPTGAGCRQMITYEDNKTILNHIDNVTIITLLTSAGTLWNYTEDDITLNTCSVFFIFVVRSFQLGNFLVWLGSITI